MTPSLVTTASTGGMKDALAAFERARPLEAGNALPLVDIGTVYMMSGETDRAEAALNDALRVDPATPRAHNALGVIAAQRSQYDAAIAHWQQAIALDPRDYQTLYNLG